MTALRQSETGFVQVGGAKLYYEVEGEGHPFVLIHGGLVDNRSWDDQFGVFAQHYRVIRYDMRGFGNTEVSTTSTEPYSFSQDLYSLLKLLGVERAYILGLSFGGQVAIDFTLEHPEMVDALLPVASAIGGYNHSEETRKLWAEIDAEVEKSDIAQAVELENRMWIDGPHRTSDQVSPAVRERVREMNTHNYVLAAALADMPSPQELEPPAISRLSAIYVPTLIIVGDQDLQDVLDRADILEKSIASAKKVVIPGTAHALNMEKPEEFNRIVLDFLSEVAV